MRTPFAKAGRPSGLLSRAALTRPGRRRAIPPEGGPEYALLSALAGLPLRQGITVTGSVNQHGEIQAVGGVTPKMEGFFAVCKAKGLSDEHGIIIRRRTCRT